MTVVHRQVEQFPEVLVRHSFSSNCICYQVFFEAPVMQASAILCKLKKNIRLLSIGIILLAVVL